MLQLILIIVINVTGFLLRFYELDRDLIIAGFRFHLSLVFPLLYFLFRKDTLPILKEYFVNPKDRRYLLTVLFITVPILVLSILLFALRSGGIGDPDYFYELGMTSVIDYPVYLIWNAPQLLALASFMVITVHNQKFKLPVIFLLMLSLFIYEFVPLKAGKFPVDDAGAFLAAVALFSLFLYKVRNIYLFAAAVFSTLWIDILLFGSSSKVMLHMLLARTYNEWSGFLEINKVYNSYITLAHFSIAFILFFIPFMLISRQHKKSTVAEYKMENLTNE